MEALLASFSNHKSSVLELPGLQKSMVSSAVHDITEGGYFVLSFIQWNLSIIDKLYHSL